MEMAKAIMEELMSPNPFGTPETDEDGDKDDSGEDGSVGKPEESGKPDTEPENGLAKTRNALI